MSGAAGVQLEARVGMSAQPRALLPVGLTTVVATGIVFYISFYFLGKKLGT